MKCVGKVRTALSLSWAKGSRLGKFISNRQFRYLSQGRALALVAFTLALLALAFVFNPFKAQAANGTFAGFNYSYTGTAPTETTIGTGATLVKTLNIPAGTTEITITGDTSYDNGWAGASTVQYSHTISVATGADLTIHITGHLTMNPQSAVTPIKLAKNSKVTLDFGESKTVKAKAKDQLTTSVAGVAVPETAKLTITGSGTLEAGGQSVDSQLWGSAGIGGEYYDTDLQSYGTQLGGLENSGEIIIGSDMTVKAFGATLYNLTQMNYCTGKHDKGDGTFVNNCNSGGANAQGGGAGIGAASGGNAVGEIIIKDNAKVTAAGGKWNNSATFPFQTVSGGYGAGIGSGKTGNVNTVRIQDESQVTVYARWWTPSTDYAEPGYTGAPAAIGTGGTYGGVTGNVGLVQISGNPTVKIEKESGESASGAHPKHGAGIGSGGAFVWGCNSRSGDVGNVEISGGTVILDTTIGSNITTPAIGTGYVGGTSCTADERKDTPGTITGNITITSGNVFAKGADSVTATSAKLNAFQKQPVNLAGDAVYPVYVPAELKNESGSTVDVTTRKITIANATAGTWAPLSADVAAKLPSSAVANACGENIACAAVAWLPVSGASTGYYSINLSPVLDRKFKVSQQKSTTPTTSVNVVLDNNAADTPSIENSALPEGTQGFDYSAFVAGAGGGITITKTSNTNDFNNLPKGLTFDTATGRIYGQIAENAPIGTYKISFKAANSKNTSGVSKTLDLVVSAGVPTGATYSHLAGGTSTVIQITQPAVTAPDRAQPISYCISSGTNITANLMSQNDARCGTSAGETNWVTPDAASAATLALDLNSLPTNETYTFGAPKVFTIFARNPAKEVYQGRQITIQMNKITFHSNGDGFLNTPTLPAIPATPTAQDWVRTQNESNPANGSTIVRYLIPGETLQTNGNSFPKSPTLANWDSDGFAFDKDSATSTCVFGDTSSYSPANAPGKSTGLCNDDFSSSTTVTKNAEVYAVWKYSPQILDFSPKKMQKAGGDKLTVAVSGLIPWGKSFSNPTDLSALNSATHIRFGSGNDGAPECQGVDIISSDTLTCTMPAGEGSGKLFFKNE